MRSMKGRQTVKPGAGEALFEALSRRRVLQMGLTAGAIAATSMSARAQKTYPTHPVHVLFGFAAGGSSDVIGRVMCQWIAERMGQPFIFENRPGANGNIATEMASRAVPDGHTLLWCNSASVINATLYNNFDFAPIAGVFRVPHVLEVHPSVPVKTVPEFIAYAKANPGKLNFASGGIGSTQHLAAEMFKRMTGTDITHVPYRGSGAALVDLVSGEVQVMFDLLPASLGYIGSGKLIALAITSTTPSKALPHVPTVSEFLPGYEVSTWNGVAAPKNTPQEVIDGLNKIINAGLADPAIASRIADLGATPLLMTPSEFGKFTADETGKWAEVIKFAGINAR
jgi:tripartite-type tricarboxylate transporter receptor subunit TctC